MGKYNHQYRNRKFFEELEEEKERIGPTPNKGVVVNAEFVRIREEPRFTSKVVGVIRQGREVKLLEKTPMRDIEESSKKAQIIGRYSDHCDSFYRIIDEYENRSGYILSEYIQEVR